MEILKFQASAKKNGLGALWFPQPEPRDGCKSKPTRLTASAIEQHQQQLAQASKTDTTDPYKNLHSTQQDQPHKASLSSNHQSSWQVKPTTAASNAQRDLGQLWEPTSSHQEGPALPTVPAAPTAPSAPTAPVAAPTSMVREIEGVQRAC